MTFPSVLYVWDVAGAARGGEEESSRVPRSLLPTCSSRPLPAASSRPSLPAAVAGPALAPVVP